MFFRVKKLRGYIKNILNGKYDFDIDDSKEIEKDILNIGKIIKSNNEYITMYEKIFEELNDKITLEEFEAANKVININKGIEHFDFENIKLSSLISKALESFGSKDIKVNLNIKKTARKHWFSCRYNYLFK